MLRATLAITAALAVAPNPTCAQVTILGGDPQGYTTIQAAVDAAQSGDTVLIPAGTYGVTRVVGKSVSLASSVPSGPRPKIKGGLEVVNVPPGKPIVIAGLTVRRIGAAGLTLLNVEAPIHILDCHIGGNSAALYSYGNGAPGSSIKGCANVVISNSSISGGSGSGDPDGLDDACHGGDGATALWVATSRILIQDSGIQGGAGGPCSLSGGVGGDGIDVLSGVVHLEGVDLRGANGGSETIGWSHCGNGGHAMRVRIGSEASLLGGLLIAGKGGSGAYPGRDGKLTAGFGKVIHHPGTPRELSWAFHSPDPATTLITVYGLPGDRVYWGHGRSTSLSQVPGVQGTWALPGPLLAPPKFLGTIPPTGVQSFFAPLPDVPPALPGALLFGQGYVEDVNGKTILGTARPFLILAP